MDKIKEFGDAAYQFVMNNYNKPMFWLIIFIIMVIISFAAIKDLADK